eukprot:227878_1
MGCCCCNSSNSLVSGLSATVEFNTNNDITEKPMSDWHQQDVQYWLSKNKNKELSKLKPIFHQHQISGLTMEKITKDELVTELNIDHGALCDLFLAQRDQFNMKQQSASVSRETSPETQPNVTETTMKSTDLFNYLSQFNMDTIKTKIIDLRTHDLFYKHHILRSVNINYSHDDDILNMEQLSIIDTNHKVSFLKHLQSFESNTKLIVIHNKTDDANAKLKVQLQTFLLKTYGVHLYILLDCDFSDFYEMYPFLCTYAYRSEVSEDEKLFELYPSEVICGALYIGDWKQSEQHSVLNDLNITHILNVCEEKHAMTKINVEYKHVEINDSLDENILDGKLTSAIQWIQTSLETEDNRVLVHCKEGISRSAAIVIGYLMQTNKWSYDVAKEYLQKKRPNICPNASFQKQLQQ